MHHHQTSFPWSALIINHSSQPIKAYKKLFIFVKLALETSCRASGHELHTCTKKLFAAFLLDFFAGWCVCISNSRQFSNLFALHHKVCINNVFSSSTDWKGQKRTWIWKKAHGVHRSTCITVSFSDFFNRLRPNIRMHILHTVFFLFSVVLIKRICFTPKTVFACLSFHFFSWPIYLSTSATIWEKPMLVASSSKLIGMIRMTNVIQPKLPVL